MLSALAQGSKEGIYRGGIIVIVYVYVYVGHTSRMLSCFNKKFCGCCTSSGCDLNIHVQNSIVAELYSSVPTNNDYCHIL